MDQVPKEIQKLILKYLDDKTKRIARLSCQQWFDFIDYRNFTFYLTKKSDWPQIANRLASYSKPISLRFAKNIMSELREFNEHLLRLTTLTDLTFARLHEREDNLVAEWFKLTSLTNLHSIEVKNGDTVPLEAILSFPNLTKFESRWPNTEKNTLVEDAFRRWTNLESCWIAPNNTSELDLFDSYNTKITRLYLQLPNAAPGKWFNQLGNIKEFIIGSKTRAFSLKSLTALERLNFDFLDEAQIHELNSTKLTSLKAYSIDEEHIVQYSKKLASVKQLAFDYKDNDQRRFSNQWLIALTNLEDLTINPLEGDGLAYISTTLTKLQITVERRIDLSHVSRFVSLKELNFVTTDEPLLDISLLSVLTKLEHLKLRLSDSSSEIAFLSSMTNLTCLSLACLSLGEITPLPNLEVLAITQSPDGQLAGLEGLSKLTHLTMELNFGRIDYTFVSNLTTLRFLWLDRKKQYECRHFSTLTNLDFLHIWEVTSEDDYCFLSTLTKLTELQIVSGPPSVKILHFPTSLQRLEVGFPYHDNPSIIDPLLERLPNLYRFASNSN